MVPFREYLSHTPVELRENCGLELGNQGQRRDDFGGRAKLTFRQFGDFRLVVPRRRGSADCCACLLE